MTRFVFESDIPSWSSPAVLSSRLDRWVSAGLDTVMLQVDDGHGATWGTSGWSPDARVTPGALKIAVDAIHARGLSVVACVSLAIFSDFYSHYPALKLSNFQFPYYNFWSAEFRAKRLQMLVDLASACDLDGIALDYLRTGREALSDEVAAELVLTGWLREVRAAISPGVPILSVNHSSYAVAGKEGVNLSAWAGSGLIDGAVLFNYERVFPAAHVPALAAPIWALIGNYDWTNNRAVIRPGLSVAHIWRRVQREISPDGIGVYLANLFTEEQATAVRNTQRAVRSL